MSSSYICLGINRSEPKPKCVVSWVGITAVASGMLLNVNH